MRTALALVGAACAVVSLLALLVAGTVLGLGVGVSGFGGLADGGYEETSLHSFDTGDPHCPPAGPTPNATEGVYAGPTEDGHRLSVVDNVTTEGASDLRASLSEIGPGRYHLSLSRTGGEANVSCERPSEMQFNATLNVSEPDDYTLVVTLDGELRGVHWAESAGTSGAAGSSRVVRADGPADNETTDDGSTDDANDTAAVTPPRTGSARAPAA